MKDVKNMTAVELIELMVSLNENLMKVAAIKANTAPIVEQAAVKVEEPAKEVKEEVKAEEPTSKKGVTQSALEAIILDVRAKFGVAHVRALVKSVAGTTTLQKIEVSKYDELFEALQAELEKDIVPKTDADITTAEEMIKAEVSAEARATMKNLLVELSQSELGEGKPTNYAKSKKIIAEIGKAPKLAEIPDENVNAVIEATKKALEELNSDEDL